MPQPDPIGAMKRQLADEILRVTRGHLQYMSARLAGIDQPRFSDLERGKLERFSLGRLVRMLAHADYQVEMTVSYVGPRIPLKPMQLPGELERHRAAAERRRQKAAQRAAVLADASAAVQAAITGERFLRTQHDGGRSSVLDRQLSAERSVATSP